MSGVRIKECVKILMKCYIPLYLTTDEQSCQRRIVLVRSVRKFHCNIQVYSLGYDRVNLTKFDALNLFSWISSPSQGLLV